MRKAIAVVVLVCVSGLLGWQVYSKLSRNVDNGGGRKRRGGAVAVEVVPVRTATVRDVRVFTGTLRPASQFVVAPKVGGRLEQLTVQLGDPVKNEQLIARIDDAEYKQQMLQAKAELEVVAAGLRQCRAKLTLAAGEFKRVKELHAKKISSESEVDTARSEHLICLANEQVALAQKAQKEAALKAAEVRLGYTRIKSGWKSDGGKHVRYVGERFVDEGAMLTPNAPIISVVDVANLRGVIHVTESDYPRMKVGQAAAVSTDAFKGEDFPSKILLISKVLREASRQARVELEVPNARLRLKPGMFIRTRVEFAVHENATVVPHAALVRHKDRRGVFLVDKKKAKFVAVETGIVEGEKVEILKPEISGFVATLGNHLLSDGADVVLPKPKKKPGGKDVEGEGNGKTGKPESRSGK